MAVVVFALLQAPTPPPVPGGMVDARRRPPEPWYVALIDRYRGGERTGALKEPLAPERALLEVTALKRLAESAQRCGPCPLRHEIDAFPFEAAVLFHTERAFDRVDRGDPAFEPEIEVAQRLMAIAPEARGRAFEPRWLRAAVQGLVLKAQWDLALRLLEPALSRYPDEARLFLVHGAALESKARQDPDTVHEETLLFGQHRRTASARRSHLADAEKSYRKALALQPDLYPARVRLGRVLQILGRTAASVPELQAVATSTAGKGERYLAHLFLGYAREAARRPADAAAEYEAALRALPDGQAAAVGLSHALHRGGRVAESEEALRRGVARAGRRADVDPWWPYLAGQSEDAEALLAALRAEVSR